MQSAVFVSHSSEDKQFTEQLCEKLATHGVDVWVSLGDILPGAEWRKEIEVALKAATHVLVVTSKASVASRWVNNEVESALNNRKTIIPLLIEDVELPLGWQGAQYIDLRKGDLETKITSLAKILPKGRVRKLEEYLAAPSDLAALRQLILGNTDAEEKDRSFGNGVIDIFSREAVIRSDRNRDIHLIFLCSPYMPAFDANGKASEELLSKVNLASQFLNRIAYLRIFDARDMLNVFILAGQRSDFLNVNVQRDEFQANWRHQFLLEIVAGSRKVKVEQVRDILGPKENTTLLSRIRVSVASYTRLLDIWMIDETLKWFHEVSK